MKKIYFAVVNLFLLFIALSSHALPSFPGAEGFGANSVGGRGGTVIKVTNLNDSGDGSFRAAVEASGPRIVVFDVSGIINLQSDLTIYNSSITIAGQTSPGGILVTGRTVAINTHDVIVQYMRFRVGSHRILDGADPEYLDSLDIFGKNWGPNTAYNIIIDHCSISWGVDETCTITGGVINTTLQWSIISEGLAYAGHPKGEHSKGLMVSGKYRYDNSVSLHHNYIAHNTDRNPLLYSPEDAYNNITVVDAVNNVSYNWKGALSPMGGEICRINWVHNYAKPGLNSHPWSYEVTHYAESLTVPRQLIYVQGNVGSSRLTQDAPQWNVGWYYYNELAPTTWQKTLPWDVPSVMTNEMSYYYALDMLQKVGATKPVRDSVDERVVADFAAGTGMIIDNVTYPDDFPAFENLPAPPDTDNDGMPDAWEAARGLSVGINDSAGDDDNDGYTNIEEYLHYKSEIIPTTPYFLIPPAPPKNLKIFPNE